MKTTIITLLTISAIFAHGTTFETQDQFTIVLPDNWIEIPTDVLNEYSENVAKQVPTIAKQVYNYGYQLRDSDGWLDYPYILVQVKNVGRVAPGELSSYRKLKEAFAKGIGQAEESFSGVMSNASFGEPVYDDEHHILWTTLSMDVEGPGTVNAITAIKLTEKGIIQFNAYATGSTFHDYADIYRAAFISLHIDESIAYKPQMTDKAPVIGGINTGKLLAAGMRGAIIGGIIGLFVWGTKRKKNPH